ncbi:peptidase S24-like protein [Pseudoduganella lurida]|uniref:Peptidase S24-like protein n=1 Tax=Pseudoduganella lurida TaxID=1036180 RepID=A0A562RKT0_9BURK|nr:XRE family transcriptional regulator [Pseudoduganella lurida]TWI69030.1 peptidase S24-like protein [Pseudoduganella lurida]
MAIRLTELLQAKNGGNQSEMARAVGVTPQAVQKWMSGVTEPRGANLDAAALFLGVSPSELKFGSDATRRRERDIALIKLEARDQSIFDSARVGEKRQAPRDQPAVHSAVIARDPEDGVPDDVVLVPESRIKFSGGNGHINYELVDEHEPATYRRSWFQKHGINPDRVRRFRVTGDSMEPMLFARDTILVNLDETEVTDGRLYALRYGDQLRVKYLSRRLDGTLVLRSVNPSYRDEEVPAELANEHITVIGRVRDRSGTGGL